MIFHKKSIPLVLLAFLTITSAEAQLLKKIKDLGKSKTLDLFEEEALDFEQYKNHVGEILFSSEDFERELPESKYVTSYTFGDHLETRAFMKNSVANSMMLQLAESGKKIKDINKWKGTFDTGSLIYKLYLDGKFITNTSYVHNFDNKEIASLATNRITLKDDSGNYKGEELYQTLLQKEELLTPGIHKLKLELIPIYNSSIFRGFDFKPIASGEIEIVIDGDASYVNLDECFPKARMTNSQLEQEITQVINSNIASGSKLSDVIISSSRWTLLRSALGNPVKKSIRAVLVFTLENGNVFYTELIFEKVFDGVEYSALAISRDINIVGEGTADTSSHFVHSKCAELLKD